MEPIDQYLLALCNPNSFAVADNIGLSLDQRAQLMDDSFKDSNLYASIIVSSIDGRILNFSLVSESEAREIEGPHMKAIVNN